MTKEQFIREIAGYVQSYAPRYGIRVCSPVIAQAVLESAAGTSELARNAHNYFGLKYRKGRCPTACGIYYKTGSEQNSDGSYTSSAAQWMKFADMEQGVRGYFDFINVPNYKNLKGITDPQTYLETIRAAGYATSLNYVANVMKVIAAYRLTKYDPSEASGDDAENAAFKNAGPKTLRPLTLNIHAGHNPDGKIACGAVGLIRESTEARRVKEKVMELLTLQGHTVYDCTVDDGTSQNDVLKKIVAKCNSHEADLDLSIHFNAGAAKSPDGKTTGTEAYIYSPASKAGSYARKILSNLSALGLRNRGVKTSQSLYFLKKTKNPALLLEILFCDDPDDAALYDADKIALAIADGLLEISRQRQASE